MSSYRSTYTPWKSSVPSNYKTGSTTSSSYSSRDDISSTPRYSSSALASPTSYRPSFSGGTYRLKRDTPATPATSYVSRYSGSSSSASSSSLAKPESSSAIDSLSMKTTSQLKRYGSTSSNLGKYSREPSPAALEHTNRIRSRDPSPVTRTLRAKSRDPSPALENRYKLSYGSANSYRMNVPKGPPPASVGYNNRYGTSRTPSSTSLGDKSISYGGTARTSSSTSLGDKSITYGGTTRTPSSASLAAEKSISYSSSNTTRTASSTSMADKSISYLTASDFRARSLNKAKELALRKSNEKELESNEATEENPITPMPQEVQKEVAKDEEEDSETTEESDTSEDDEIEEPPEQFLSITVCTRGTSPTPPGSTPTTHLVKRADIAKTIEKTLLRSTKKRKMLEKEIQSDRLDDSTKYSRFGSSSRLSPYSPRSDRYSPSNLRYSSSPVSTTSKSTSLSTNESKREDSTTSSSSASRTPKSPAMKSKLSPPKVSKLKSRQPSMESLSPHKPPAVPKAESPLKSSSPSSTSLTKLPNKDFRKSALNVGPTDRSRKSRTPSTGTDSDFNTVDALNGALQAIQRLERSPSAGSEISNASNRSLMSRNLAESKLRPRCHSKPLGSRTPPSPLSRQNSATNFKQKSTPITSPLAMRSTKILVTTATSSSSGTESSVEAKKPHKKIIKKKAIKDICSPSTTTASSTTTLSSTNNSDSQSISGKSAQAKSIPSQPPVAESVATTISASGKAKKAESSALKKSSSASSRADKDPLRRLKKLSSVSNFFVTQQNNTNSDEQIYLESSETSGGGAGSGSGGGGDGATSTDLDVGSSKSSKKSNSLTRANEPKTSKSTTPAKTTNGSTSANASNCNSPVQYTRDSQIEHTHRIKKSSTKSTASSTKSKSKSKSRSASVASSSYCPQNSSTLNESSRMPTELQSESSPHTTSTTATTSTTGTDSEEASWWQDTSQQIDTSSALDFSFKDEMRFKVRHVDSGEAAWWLRNDDEDTLADDLATLNQDEEDDGANDIFDEDIAGGRRAAGGKNSEPGWWETDTNEPNENVYQNEMAYRPNGTLDNLDYKTNGYYSEVKDGDGDAGSRALPRSRLTPETDWWNDDEEGTSADADHTHSSETAPKQNGIIQLRICRVESGENTWCQQEEQEQQPQNHTEEQEIRENRTPETSEPSSTSVDPKKWWMSAPTKRLFNIPRVESGEKAWWQQTDSSDKDSQRSKSQDLERKLDPMHTQTAVPKKLFHLPRVDSGETASWWPGDSSDKENISNKSQEHEQWIEDRNQAGQSPPQKLFHLPRVDSDEKAAWWPGDSSDKENTRSKSQDQEQWKDESNQVVQTPPHKLFHVPRVDTEEKAAWWQEEEDKKRSRSQDSERWLDNKNRLKQQCVFYQTATPPGESNALDNTEEQQLENHYHRQQSLHEQKERWLKGNTQPYQDQSSKEQTFPDDTPECWLENNTQPPPDYYQPATTHSFQSTNDDVDNDDNVPQFNHATTFLPPHRADSQTELSNSFNFEYSERPPPLGQCASPVQHEEERPRRLSHCSSPYDNIPMTKVQQTTASHLMPILGATPPPPSAATASSSTNASINTDNASAYQQEHLNQQQHQELALPTQSPQRPQQYNNNDLRSKTGSGGKLFISRHQNIDELLSGACRPLSPLFFDNDGSFATMPPQRRNMFLEEITPDQVRIHDSTAQLPFIQRMERDDWDRDSQPITTATNSKSPPRFEQRTMERVTLSSDIQRSLEFSNLL